METGEYEAAVAAFTRECWSHYTEAIRLIDYDATAWSAMIQAHGAVAAAQRLVLGPDTSGLFRLKQANLLRLTVEQSVLNHPDLFDQAVLDRAEFRLRELRKEP